MRRPTLALRPLCQKLPKFFELWLHSNVMGPDKKILAVAPKSGPPLEHICRSVEGVYDAPSETNFKTKASKQGPAGIGGRRIIIVTRKRRVRSPEWAGGYAKIESLSVRKTSAWRRSTPSTRKAK